MDEIQNRKFRAISAVHNAARLRCEAASKIRGLLAAYVNGIEVGSKILDRNYAHGETVDIPIHYFPHVVLPCEIRFAVDDAEMASPLAVHTADQVTEIIGPGDIRVDAFAIDNGLLRGSIINTSNGVHVPNAHVRLNRRVVRPVVIEPIRPRFEGGSTCSFAVPIRLSDLSLSGLEIELFVAGIEQPLANLAYSNTQLNSLTESVLSLEEGLRQLQKSTTVQMSVLSAAMERRLLVQQERLDAFIEYALCILLDITPGKLTDGNVAMLNSELRRVAHFANASQPENKERRILPESAVLPLDSTSFAIGWYENESNETGQFRWMTESALVRNPFPQRDLRHLEILIGQVYGAHEPMVDVSLDEEDMEVEVGRRGTFFLVKAHPRDGSKSRRGESLYLRSFASGCPAADTGSSDQRTLSLAVNKVEFFYES